MLLTCRLTDWLASSAARTLEDMYESLGGNRPIGLTVTEREGYDQRLKRSLEEAFRNEHLVAFEVARPEYGGGGRAASLPLSPRAAPVPRGLATAGGPRPSIAPTPAAKPPTGTSWATYRFEDLGRVAPCLAPGTWVKVPGGTRRIEEVAVGDKVLAWDAGSRAAVECRVTQVLRGSTRHLVEVRLGEEALLATRLHPFWAEDRGEWMPAWRLWEGHRLLAVDGGSVAVEAVEPRQAESPTYNLEVEGAHCFFVGERGVLVHNGRGRKSGFEKMERKPVTIYAVRDVLTGEIIYVGQTTQPLRRREGQHRAKRSAWKARGEELEFFEIERKHLTRYEAAVRELHHIKQLMLAGHPLENDRTKDPIGGEKFQRYQSLHDPCR